MDKQAFRQRAMTLHPDHGGSHDEFLAFMKQAKGDPLPDNAKQTAVSEMFALLQSGDLASMVYVDIPREVAERLRSRTAKLTEQQEHSERVADDLEELAERFTEVCLMSTALQSEATRLREQVKALQPQIDNMQAAAEYAETIGFEKEEREECSQSMSYTIRGNAYW